MSEINYETLIIKKLTGEISDSEYNIFEKWLNKSEENKALFSNYKKMWEEVKVPQPSERFSKDAVWQRIQNELEPVKSKSEFNLNFFSDVFSSIFSPMRVALSALAVVLIGLLYVFYFNQSKPTIYLTKKGERSEFTLPDNSKVFLNVESRIEFNWDNEDNLRLVKLSGEALFSVTSNGKPFIVKTENAQVKVLGTKFFIKSRNQQTKVWVKEGRVSFGNLNDDPDSIILNKNQMSLCVGTQIPEQPVNIKDDNFPEWNSDKIIFRKTELAEAFNELQRIFNVRIIVNNKEIAKQTITAKFNKTNIESIISSICLTMELEYNKKNSEYYVKKKRQSLNDDKPNNKINSNNLH